MAMQETFESVRADIERRLRDGVENRNSAMHTPVVATGNADARIMVLRDFDAQNWTLRFHTDVRAPKVPEIEADPRVGVLAYDRGAKLQLRGRGSGRIERNGPVADAAWEESTNFARRCYLGEGPGARSDKPTSGLPEWIEGEEPSETQVQPARENFAVLIVHIDEIDWFYLSNDGHRRAVLTRTGKGRWIAP